MVSPKCVISIANGPILDRPRPGQPASSSRVPRFPRTAKPRQSARRQPFIRFQTSLVSDTYLRSRHGASKGQNRSERDDSDKLEISRQKRWWDPISGGLDETGCPLRRSTTRSQQQWIAITTMDGYSASEHDSDAPAAIDQASIYTEIETEA